MKRFSLMLLAAALLLGAATAQAALVITFAQSGPDVVATGTGSLDWTSLGFNGFDFNSSYVNASAGGLLLGSSGTYADYYGTISGPTSFGSGGNIFADASTSTAPGGTGAGVDGATGQLLVPGGYFAGDPFTVSATWYNTTISGLGLAPGTYTWTWATDSLVINVPTSTPEPGSIVLLSTGLIGLAGAVRRKLSM
jgi:hypothetical protein